MKAKCEELKVEGGVSRQVCHGVDVGSALGSDHEGNLLLRYTV